MDLNYQIGIDILHKKAEKAIKSLDTVMKQKFQSMTNYNQKFNRETLLSQRLSRQLLETETMGLSQMQKFYSPIITNKKKMTKLSDAWHKSESKSLREVTSLMKLNKTEQLGYLRRIGASADEMKRDTTFTKMNKNAKAKLLGIESSRVKGLNEIGKTVSKTLKMEKEGLMTLSAAQKKQYANIQRVTEGYKSHYKAIGVVKRGMSSLLGTIKKAGMIFLTVLGPLFLVGAALRTVKQAADWIYQPFIKFEDALYELRKTANLTNEAMLEMGEAVAELSLRVPIAAEELAKIAATAGRLGIRSRKDIMKFTETVAMMATATVLTADEAAEALARIRQAFDIPIDKIEYLGSVINELSNTTASNSRDIVAALGNVGAAGKMLGITVDEAAAMGVTLIASGMAAERAGTRIRRALTEIARKSAEITVFMGEQGRKWRIALETDPMQALTMYLEKLSHVESNVERLEITHAHFGKVGGFAIASLAENYDELIKNLETANDEMIWGTSLQREFKIATTKTSAELQILANRAEIARREIGENFVPALITAKGATVEVTEALAKLSTILAITRGETGLDITPLEVYAEELKKIREERERGITTIDKTSTATILLVRRMLEIRNAMDLIKFVPITPPNMKSFIALRGLTDDYRQSIGTLEKALDDVGREQEIANIVYDETKMSLREAADEAKKYGDFEINRLKPLRTYMRYKENEDKIRAGIIGKYDDEIERKEKIAEYERLESILFEEAVKASIPYLENSEKIIGTDLERSVIISNLKVYQDETSKSTYSYADAIDYLDRTTEIYIGDLSNAMLKTEIYKDTIRDLADAHVYLEGNIRDLDDAQIALFSTSFDLLGVAEDTIGIYSQMYNLWDRIQDTEEEAEGITKKMIRRYDDERDAIKKLVGEAIELEEEGDHLGASAKIVEAATLSNTVALELNEKAMKAKTNADRDAWSDILGWWGDNLKLTKDSTKGVGDLNKKWGDTTGEIDEAADAVTNLPQIIKDANDAIVNTIKLLHETVEIPEGMEKYGETWEEINSDVKEIAKAVEEIPMSKELALDLDSEKFWESYTSITKRLEEPIDVTLRVKEIVTGIKGLDFILKAVEEEVPSEQFGGTIPKTGIYQLHKGEEVIPAHEVRNYNKHDINVRINFAGNVPSGIDNVEVKKIVHDEIAKAVRATY